MSKYLNKIKAKIRHYLSRAKLAYQQVRGTARDLIRPVLETTSLDDGTLVFSGRMLLNCDVDTAILTVRKFREERITHDFPITLAPIPPHGLKARLAALVGLRWHSFDVAADLPWGDLPSSIYGLAITVNGVVTSIRTKPEACQIHSDDAAGRTFCVFIEPSVRVLRIEMYHLNSTDIAGLVDLTQQPRNHALHCILGEYTNTARDNARSLFEWLQRNAPDVKSTYVVEKDNIDTYSVDQDGVVEFGSLKHLQACIGANVCAFTHHRSYVYPFIINMMDQKRYKTTRTIFLQHGITAMKKSVARHYKRTRVGYSAVCVCSQSERLIFRQHFGYRLEQVFATGFPRFDSLFDKNQGASSDAGQVLFFPTWRAGIEKETSETVATMPFFLAWSSAMKAAGETLGLRRVLILHPMLHRHADLFLPFVEEIREPSTFQDSLVESACLVTDYSSVSFDALFLHKPVFLYQFDQEDYGLREDAFIDIDTQLPGNVSLEADMLLDKIKTSHAAGWPFDLQPQRDLYFDNCDNQNSARTLALIRTLAMTN